MIGFMIAVYVVVGAYMLLNFKYDIQMLQQNSYRIDRYWRWLDGRKMGAWRLVDVALLFMLFANFFVNIQAVPELLVAIACATKIVLILRRRYKKPLVFTKRVWRIYSVTAVLALILCAMMCIFYVRPEGNPYAPTNGQMTIGVGLVCSIFSYCLVTAAVWLLKPVEEAINRRYYNDAARILRSMEPDLTVIGITGSYGKTSTKHYLNRILAEEYDVLMTPGSFNTPMGVIRTVREMMKPYHRVFICEMGAKQTGDVKEICDLVHPRMGIITAVGPMHLESFHTIENVQATKFELADALPADGVAVINNDFEYCANRPVDNVEAVRYAVSNTADAQYCAQNIKYSPEGTTFEVAGPDGLRLELRTQLVGECNISNLLGAVIVALRMGMRPESIRRAVGKIEQVEHRLNMKRTPGGVTIIDDAFNSNPTGSKMAVDVLGSFADGRRIIVTPGMIELGDKQYELNRELGKHIGESVDIAIIVGEYNRDALTDGVRSTDFDTENLVVVDSFAKAQEFLGKTLRKGDVVLYENDLPDTFK